jgi:hypothetical protein
MKTLIPLALCVSMFGCTATKSIYTKTPQAFGSAEDPTMAEAFDLNLNGLAGEGLLWDNYNKNIVLFSTKDDALSGVSMDITFEGSEMASLSLAIGSKTSISSTPSEVAWQGLSDVLIATYGEEGLAGAIGVIVEAAAKGFTPVSVEVE